MSSSLELDKVHSLSQQYVATHFERLIKAQEELGELSAAVLNKHQSVNRSFSSENNVLEEGVDTLLCILDLVFTYGYSTDNIQEMIDLKSKKWEQKLLQRELEREAQSPTHIGRG